MSAKHIVDGWTLSFVGDQVGINLGFFGQFSVHQLRHAAVASVVEFARILTCELKQLLGIFCRDVRVSDQHIHIAPHHGNRGKVFNWVVGRFFTQERNLHHRRI